jgi:hypothetical protein
MSELGLDLDSAQQSCRRARSIIYPNPGFMHQLKSFENKLKTERFIQN